MQGQIEDAAYREARAQQTGESVVVGVNRFTAEASATVPLLRVDPALERGQVARLEHWRAARGSVGSLLSAVEETARSSDNLLPVMGEALRGGATIGEISDVLRVVFGTHR
jgi:methylmalonyl-CoA mutase, N-terminal domain